MCAHTRIQTSGTLNYKLESSLTLVPLSFPIMAVLVSSDPALTGVGVAQQKRTEVTPK